MDHEKWLEQHDRMMADFDHKMAKLEESHAQTERALRRAIRLSVLDARKQRERNAEFDKRHAEHERIDAELKETMNRLATTLDKFMQRATNGKH